VLSYFKSEVQLAEGTNHVWLYNLVGHKWPMVTYCELEILNGAFKCIAFCLQELLILILAPFIIDSVDTFSVVNCC
jgi:hypothetical protein